MWTNGHGKCAALNDETRGARSPLPSPPPQAVEGDKVSLREFNVNGHGKCAALDNETRGARSPLPSPLGETTSHSTKLQRTAAKSLVTPQAVEGDKVSLRELNVNGVVRCLTTTVLTALMCLPLLAEAGSWAELTPIQQEALAPLDKDWNTLANKQQQHFIKLSNHYAKLTPEKKERLHKQLVAWSKLTPEQRKRAREKYIAVSKAPPEKREQVKNMLREREERKAAASSVQPVAATHQP